MLGMGAIWNFAKGTGQICVFVIVCYNLVPNMGHKGPVLRPRCIGPKYYSILFYKREGRRFDSRCTHWYLLA